MRSIERARPSEPLSRASSLYDEDSLANEAQSTADLTKLGLDAKGLRISTAVEIVADYLASLGIPTRWVLIAISDQVGNGIPRPHLDIIA